MRQRSLVKLGAPLLVTALALSACGSRSSGSSSGTGSDSGATKTATIGVIAPLSGDLSSLGLGIRNSVDLAIRQANEKKAIPGWTLKMQAEDDQATPAVGQQAATKLAGDTSVVGVVGTLNSSVAQSVQPVLNKANIVEVSPANTNPALTQGQDPAAKKRPFPVYFRTATTDAIQGPFAAQYVFETLKITKVATVHDKKAYGQGLVEAFTGEFKKLGGQVVAAETINPDDKDFSSVVSKIKPSAPALVYYGGEYPQAAPLSGQMKAAGLKVPLMGGDGLFDPKYITLASAGAAGDLATSVGAPTESLDSAKAFVDSYAAAKFSDPFAAYGAYAFDAAQAIIEALKVSLKDAKAVDDATRKATVEAMQKVSFDGATGKVAFDEFGDNVTKVLTVYKVTGGKWAPEKTGEFK